MDAFIDENLLVLKLVHFCPLFVVARHIDDYRSQDFESNKYVLITRIFENSVNALTRSTQRSAKPQCVAMAINIESNSKTLI